MNLEINSEHIDSSRVKQILKFYLGRLDNQILKLTVNLDKLEQQDSQFRVSLKVVLNNGSRLEFMNVQNNLLVATQRVLDRLVRHLQLKRKRQRYLRHL